MKKLFALFVLLLASFPAIAGRLDCKVKIVRHERHTTKAQKKEAYRRGMIPWEKRSCCVVDHIVPLELGGADEVSNMQIQTKVLGKLKDKDENRLRDLVCDGKITLVEARRQMRIWASKHTKSVRIIRYSSPASRTARPLTNAEWEALDRQLAEQGQPK